jgi:hypothetical protein
VGGGVGFLSSSVKGEIFSRNTFSGGFEGLKKSVSRNEVEVTGLGKAADLKILSASSMDL